MLEMEKRKKKSKKSLLETKALQNKNLISTFKAGGAVPSLGGGSRGFQVQRCHASMGEGVLTFVRLLRPNCKTEGEEVDRKPPNSCDVINDDSLSKTRDRMIYSQRPKSELVQFSDVQL